MKKLYWAILGSLSLAMLAPAGLSAPVRNTAPYVPTTSIGFGAVGDTFVPVTDETPLPVAIISGGGGGGGSAGTEYTEDAASASNPTGPIMLCRRRDTPTSSEVSADSDNIVINCTSKGELRVRDTDLISALGSPLQAGGNIGNISGTVSLPTGAATAANQTTQTTSIDAISTRIGATTSPAAGTSNKLLTDILAGVTSPALPTGAATAAKQPALGTASSPSSDVITTVQASTAASAAGVNYVSDAAAAAKLIKSSAGNVYGVNVQNSTTAGYVVIYDASSLPSASASLTASSVLYCLSVQPSTGISDHWAAPIAASSGIQLMFSTSCSTRTDVSPAPVSVTVYYK